MWQEENNQLVLSVRFPDFSTAWAFMSQVSVAVERMNHHPDWQNVYNLVTIRLSTHEAGNTITGKDRELAQVITGILHNYPFELV